ncbi:MAG: large conductance mechanosensitive channel protein MscL [Clostridia bacterium]|nr:large conductance mechanosensitive channel protein MscL [Clostridia bacterium]
MKKFFAEFKKFITRGNVIDMAVGVIVGSSFTAIVNAMSNQILKPIINWILSLILEKDSLSEMFTFLTRVDTKGENGEFLLDEFGNRIPDLKESIYIDWGTFINAIINFFLIALVLFTIVKLVNKARAGQKSWADGMMEGMMEGKPTREERKEMKKAGIKFSNKAAVAAFYAEKAKKLEEEKKAAAEKARLEREANPTTEDLLKQIRDLLQKNA